MAEAGVAEDVDAAVVMVVVVVVDVVSIEEDVAEAVVVGVAEATIPSNLALDITMMMNGLNYRMRNKLKFATFVLPIIK